jgi:hypothetical protein
VPGFLVYGYLSPIDIANFSNLMLLTRSISLMTVETTRLGAAILLQIAQPRYHPTDSA